VSALGSEEEFVKNAMTRHLCWASIGLLCCAAGAFADVGMTLTGVDAGYVMGGVYTSPYSITVTSNGVSTPMQLICDDFLTDIPSIPYSWSAIQTDISDIANGSNPLGTPKFTPVQFVQYATAAILASELLALPTYYSEMAGDYSYSIWGVFDPTLLSNNPGNGQEGHLSSTELTFADQYLVAAVNSATGSACATLSCADNILNGTTASTVNMAVVPDLVVYTPDPKSASQEFLGIQTTNGNSLPTAEPSYPVILAVDLLAVVGLIVVLRKRLVGVFN